jgi:hypothetical protein
VQRLSIGSSAVDAVDAVRQQEVGVVGDPHIIISTSRRGAPAAAPVAAAALSPPIRAAAGWTAPTQDSHSMQRTQA